MPIASTSTARRSFSAEWCETGVRLDDLVAHVTIHEIGHHFGLSDDDVPPRSKRR
ncbi:metallopeptidase family protein [Sphingomonas sp. MMS24-JH45]